MKTKQLKRFMFNIAIIAFLLLLAGNAFAANKNPNRGGISISGTTGSSEYSNDWMVAAPYWQVDSGSYTFIAVSHSSLSGMASQIGVVVNALKSDGVAYDDAAEFTVSAGTTERLFIVPTNHATINPTSITSASFMVGTSDFSYGHVRVYPKASHPELKDGGVLVKFNKKDGAGFRDATMLTYWGSVIIEANTTGFAMEFIGDMNDSQTPSGLTANTGQYMSSGVNLQ